MKCIETEIAEILLFEPQVFGDERGFLWKHFASRISLNVFKVEG